MTFSIPDNTVIRHSSSFKAAEGHMGVQGFRGILARACCVCICLVLFACSGENNEDFVAGTPGAEEAVGERLFLETRFAQAFKTFVDGGGTVNDPLPAGDAVLDDTQTIDQPLPGPFAGLTMNCRACHLVDEHVSTPGGGMRTYADFARRSPLPERGDGKSTTPRNAPPLVNASLDRPDGPLFHFDAEFSTLEEVIAETFTGRNFGWLPGQKAEAIQHIAAVVRDDDGTGDLAQQFDGLAYRILFTGTGPAIPEEFRLTSDFRVSVDAGTDQEVFAAVVRVVAAYVKGLQFSGQDDNGNLIRSPFDVFLQINGLPQQPSNNESPLDYSRRLLQLVLTREQNGTLQFVTAHPHTTDGLLQFHPQDFTFGFQELEGLKLFLTEPPTLPLPPGALAEGKIGNCVACHPAPNFTDFKLHNTGVTQREYDSVHGPGQFALLSIPTLAQRQADPQQYLPATHAHPTYQEPFRAMPSATAPLLTDLGLWNIFANADFPAPQEKIRAILCAAHLPQPCPDDSTLLDEALARFKTPGLRDLGHGAPYMHNGQFDTLEDIIRFYIGSAAQARQGTLRNGAGTLQGTALLQADIAPLVAFLKSLNEDYQ
jgi:cytochrome c peroxidase